MTTPPTALDTTARPPCQSQGSHVRGRRVSRTLSPARDMNLSLRRGELTQTAARKHAGTRISQASCIAGGALAAPAATNAAAAHAHRARAQRRTDAGDREHPTTATVRTARARGRLLRRLPPAERSAPVPSPRLPAGVPEVDAPTPITVPQF